jgi:hypothetical protein
MSKHPVPEPEDRPILLRAFAEPAKAARKTGRSSRPARAALGSSEWSVVFDCETTTDPGQALRFGFCQVYLREELRQEVCFFRPGGITKKEFLLLDAHSKASQYDVMPCDEFIDKVLYKYGYHCRAMIIGFNLPFDLSRLAIGHSAARTTRRDKSMYGGFSLKLSPFPWCPPVQIKHLSRNVSLMRFTGYQSPTSRSQWKFSAPESHKAYVDQIDTKLSGKLKPLIRLAKAWKFYRNVPIRSFYLEMRVADLMDSETVIVYEIDLKNILNTLWKDQLADVRDPRFPNSNLILSACSSLSSRTDALSILSNAATWSEQAMTEKHANRPGAAIAKWNLVYADRFPKFGF